MSKTAPATPDDSQNFAPFAPVLGQIGTLIACAGALVAQLTPPQLRGLAIAVWIAGLLFQIAASPWLQPSAAPAATTNALNRAPVRYLKRKN